MLQISLVYFVLWLSFQILASCQVTSFNPESRHLHTATHIDNKLYILGGTISDSNNVTNDTNEFFYLDVSGPFNTKTLSWQNLSNNTIPAHSLAAAVVGGANNNTLFLYEGTDPTALAYSFDPVDKTWTPHRSSDVDIISRRELTGVNNNGNMYLWGGLASNGTDMDGMLILDTIKLNLNEINSNDAPFARHNYGAVLLPDKNIIYIGGFNNALRRELSLNEIYLYDTNNNTWSIETAKGQISERDGFSAVLGLDGQRIIIFGGTASVNFAPLVYEDSLYVLNLSNYEWTVPKSSGDKPKSRMYHRTNVIGKYMVTTFGKGYDQSTESDILLLDISNNDEYVWTNTFDLSPPLLSSSSNPAPTQTNSASSPDDKLDRGDNKRRGAITGTIIGSLIGVASLSFGGFYFYKWYKNNKQKQEDVILVPSANYNQGERNMYDNHGKGKSTTNHEPIVIPAPTLNFSHGSEENLSRRNINDLKNELKQEIIQDLRQEIIQNNNSVKNS